MTRPGRLTRWWRHLCFVWPWGHDAVTERARIREEARVHYLNRYKGLFQ